MRSLAFSVASPIAIWKTASSALEASGRIRSSASRICGQSSSGRPALLERLPDLLDEEVDEGAGDAVGVAAELRGGRQRGLGADAELGQLGAGLLQARADHLDPAVGQLAQDAELFAALA